LARRVLHPLAPSQPFEPAAVVVNEEYIVAKVDPSFVTSPKRFDVLSPHHFSFEGLFLCADTAASDAAQSITRCCCDDFAHSRWLQLNCCCREPLAGPFPVDLWRIPELLPVTQHERRQHSRVRR
jgi:hypothetical protein